MKGRTIKLKTMTVEASAARTARAPARSYPRIIIEHVRPAADAGRFPVKRIIGDKLIVEATVDPTGDLAAGAALVLEAAAKARGGTRAVLRDHAAAGR